MARMMAHGPWRSGWPTPRPALDRVRTVSSRAVSPPRGRGTPMAPGAGTTVADRILMLAVGVVGRGQWLG
jgi:hypothetical protein